MKVEVPEEVFGVKRGNVLLSRIRMWQLLLKS